LHLAVQAIMAEEGTLDKIMGDELMAIYNAPVPQEDHALRAVRTALAMQAAFADYNRAVTEDVALQWGIGLNLGPAIVGNIGTEQQMSFTAIGDAVNLARRLQESAEAGQILMSEEIYRAVRDQVRARDVGFLKLKGRSASVHAYLLLGLA
jgi:class 3 adenylate cyclase